jgi:hypothetical protein
MTNIPFRPMWLQPRARTARLGWSVCSMAFWPLTASTLKPSQPRTPSKRCSGRSTACPSAGAMPRWPSGQRPSAGAMPRWPSGQPARLKCGARPDRAAALDIRDRHRAMPAPDQPNPLPANIPSVALTPATDLVTRQSLAHQQDFCLGPPGYLTATVISPMRSKASVMTSPGLTGATPWQVPVMMMSPG